MQLIGIENIVFLCFGAAMVGIYSWSRFDEPSCDNQSEYFTRFKPRFSTSYTLYTRAKLGYACAIILLYCILSFVPELFVALAGAGPNAIPSKHVSPLVVALAIVSLQNAPVLRDVECRIRGFLHAFARIPECVRRTVACMRSSPFNFNRDAVAAQTRKLNLRETSNTQLRAVLTNLLNDDDLLHGWYSVGCVLCALSDRSSGHHGHRPAVFRTLPGRARQHHGEARGARRTRPRARHGLPEIEGLRHVRPQSRCRRTGRLARGPRPSRAALHPGGLRRSFQRQA